MKPWMILASMLLIILAALIITIALTAGWNEKETLEEAEWLIADFCNENLTCDDCYKFNKKEDKCKYKMSIPGKWIFIDEGDFKNTPAKKEGCGENGNV